MRNLIVLGAVIAWVAGCAFAQVREGSSYYESAGGNRFCGQANSYQMSWRWRVDALDGSGSLAMPFDRPGDIAALGGDAVLAGGLNSTDGSGYLARVAFENVGGAVQAAVTDTVAIGQIDPLNVWSNGADVLVLDGRTGWLFASVLPVGMAGLVLWPIADGSNMPTVLGDPAAMFLVKMETNPANPLACVVGLDFSGFGIIGLRFQVQRVQGVWSVAQLIETAASVPDVWGVDVVPHATASGDLELRIGLGSGPFEVRDIDLGSVVYSGTHTALPTGAFQSFLVPRGQLIYGHRYEVVSAGGQSRQPSAFFRCVMVWDRRVETADMKVGRIDVRWDYPSVGNDVISWGDLHHVQQQQVPLITVLLVGAWNDGVDPTMASGLGVDILGVQYLTLGPIATDWGPDGSATSAFSLDGNNPAYSGLKVAFQFVGLLPTAEWIASDVAGVIIH